MQDEVQSSKKIDSAESNEENRSDIADDSMQIVQETIKTLWENRESIPVRLFSKKHIFKDFPMMPKNVKLGWIKLSGKKHGIAIGLFNDDCKRFRQLAVADFEGRVYTGHDISIEDTIERIPELSFVEQNSMTLKDSLRFYGVDDKKITHASHARKKVNSINKNNRESDLVVIRGDVVVQLSQDEGMQWVSSWIRKVNDKKEAYTLEETRVLLPDRLRCNLSYCDAISTSFFASFFIPDITRAFSGFGSGNIFRRLTKEAPLGAIRRSIMDSKVAEKAGLRVSSMEKYFAYLMLDSGALEHSGPLEAVHGAERLHLQKSQVSDANFLVWDDSLEAKSALKVLRIEGAINRFQSISSCLEENCANGGNLTENSVNFGQISEIDLSFIEDPAFCANGELDMNSFGNPLQDDNIRPLMHLWNTAKKSNDLYIYKSDGSSNCEWSYRQRLSGLIRSLYLPFRFDTDFRSNLEDGNVALAFMATGNSMMPTRRFDSANQKWITLTNADKSRMTTDYNLRLGIIMATLAFGASEEVQNVSIRLDSIGLEEMVAAQDDAMSKILNQTINALNNMNREAARSKGDPKDGDIHGDVNNGLANVQDLQNFTNHPILHEDEVTVPDSSNKATSSKSINSSDSYSDTEISDSNTNDIGSDPIEPDPMDAFSKYPTVKSLLTVTFNRESFIKHIRANGLNNPLGAYKKFNANMKIDEEGALNPIEPSFDLRDSCFSPHGAQEEPEFSDVIFDIKSQKTLGTTNSKGLSIQREDLLQQAVADFHHISSEVMISNAEKARMAMDIVESIDDPELNEKANLITSALIDEKEIPEISFKVSKDIYNMRLHAHEQFMSGDLENAIEEYENAVKHFDSMFSFNDVVPRYFNSYAERVVYNRIFATQNERMILIPDGLFYAHMELADLLTQLSRHEDALKHLNTMVSYAPTYVISHLKLASQLTEKEDWTSVEAVCLNALPVCFDREDAAFIYYRLAYAEWMQDNFPLAVAAYKMADNLSSGKIESIEIELDELLSRMQSQCIPAPNDMSQVEEVLKINNVPKWPDVEAYEIIDEAAKITVNEGMFVIARTLSVARARMLFSNNSSDNVVQMQFLRSLNS